MNTKTKIFFDTNILEVREAKSLSSVSKFNLSKAFYDIIKFVRSNNLEKNIELHIPKIVLLEMKSHLIECEKQNRQSFQTAIDKAKKVFGATISIDVTYDYGAVGKSGCSPTYEEYLDRMIDDFLNLHDSRSLLTITSLPQKYDGIIDRAINGVLPFFAIKNADVTDAGFKDAVLLESILHNADLQNESVILFTSDHRFRDLDTIMYNIPNRESLITEDNVNSVLEVLKKTFAISEQNELMRNLKMPYYLNRLLEHINQKPSTDTEGLHIVSVEKDGIDEGIYQVSAHCTINEALYVFRFSFDTIANDILENVEYSIQNA